MMHVLCNKAIEYQMKGYDSTKLYGSTYTPERIAEIINEGDWKTAEWLLDNLFVYKDGVLWRAIKAEMLEAKNG